MQRIGGEKLILSFITSHFGCFTILEALLVPKVIGTSLQGYGKTMRTRRLMGIRDRLRNYEEEI